MRRPWWLLIVLAGCCAGRAASRRRRPGAQPPPARHAGAADPEHYQRLRRDLHAFYALPPEPARSRLRELDRELHEGDVGRRRRGCGPSSTATPPGWTSCREDRPPPRRSSAGRRRAAEGHPRAARAAVGRAAAGEDARRAAACCRPTSAAAADRRAARGGARAAAAWQRGTAEERAEPARPAKMSDFPPEVQKFVEDADAVLSRARRKERLRQAGGQVARPGQGGARAGGRSTRCCRRCPRGRSAVE